MPGYRSLSNGSGNRHLSVSGSLAMSPWLRVDTDGQRINALFFMMKFHRLGGHKNDVAHG